MKWLARIAERVRLGLGGTSKESASEKVVFPTIAVWESVQFDEVGFRLRDGDVWVRWDDVVQIACVYEIHPVIIEDWDYVAFRCRDPRIATWVLLKGNESFIAEVERRFAALAVLPIGQWADNDRCICSYTVWPHSRVGAPLFVTKRHPETGDPTIAFLEAASVGPGPIAVERSSRALQSYPEDICRRVIADYQADAIWQVHVWLEDLKTDRLARCALFLAQGSIDKLRQLVAVGTTDSRNLIVAAEYDAQGNRVRDFDQPFG